MNDVVLVDHHEEFLCTADLFDNRSTNRLHFHFLRSYVLALFQVRDDDVSKHTVIIIFNCLSSVLYTLVCVMSHTKV